MRHFALHGKEQEVDYFEGWYLKLVDKNNNYSYAFIFGMTLAKDDPHAFIEIININKTRSQYLRFNINDFNYNNNMVFIGENVLSPDLVKIDTPNLKINIEINNHETLNVSALNPSTMGYLKYLPMATAHEIIYTNANFDGTIKTKWRDQKFTGNAYLEKNWGNMFPKKWMWIEANNFANTATTFTMAVVDIYNMKQKFFFAILRINGEEHRFSNYTFASVEINKVTRKQANIIFTKDDMELYVYVKEKDTSTIIAPIKNGVMSRRIGHSINSLVKLTLYKNNKVIFSDRSNDAGYENLY